MFGLDKDEFDVSQETGKYHETNMLYLDISKAQKELGWHPKIDLRSSLALTVSWYQRYFQKNDMRHVCEEQIEYYEKMLSETSISMRARE
jgi:dTDP-D-glucose 4,6-dehydratase